MHPTSFKIRFALALMAALCCQFGLLYAGAEATLDELEQRLFSMTYPQENSTRRLDRLEQRVFGDVQAGTDSSRRARLQGVLKNLLPPGSPQSASSQNATPTQSAPSGLNPASARDYSGSAPPAIPDATDYPTVTALERQVFGRDFTREDVQVRLSRLEKKVFGQANPNRALADRVDSLLSRYPNVTASASTAPDVINVRPSAVSPALQSLPDDHAQFTSTQRDIYSKLEALEQHHFNGQSTPNALITERLDRLELKAYGQTFNGQSVDNRVARLLSPYQSHRTANPNTASSQGGLNRPGFQPRPGYQSPAGTWQSSTDTGTGTSTIGGPPRNIQIGGGFSSNSSYSFSPEMMSMLPPQVRSQLGESTSSGTVIGSPGTVVIERQALGSAGSHSGFQTYGNAPVQTYNYYSSPNGTVSQSQSTTVIQPHGGQTTLETTTSGYPTPYYVGDPAFLQSLNQLEINVFRQVNTVEAVPVRLGRLESSLLGQMYPALPEPQRLANLEKTYRLQAVSKLLGQSKGANLGRGVGSLFMGVPLNAPNPMNPMGMPQPLPINPGVFGR
ncbi:hypothetical protein [Vampirovibrio chlorellavorus]|uniref:hypothetical protein n=1 Tax=Vampirovibrio chlorellavorus TaxID=758823 RepID=UPI0026ECFD45|nr:hypothetical protein [Vampirovibrio chlorellavorus]